jgi:hypothetical protein
VLLSSYQQQGAEGTQLVLGMFKPWRFPASRIDTVAFRRGSWTFENLRRHVFAAAVPSCCPVSALQLCKESVQRSLPCYSFFTHLVKVMGPRNFLGPLEILLVEQRVTKPKAAATKGTASSLPLVMEKQFNTGERLQVCYTMSTLLGTMV